MDYFKYLSNVARLNRKKTDPYKFIFTGSPGEDKTEIQLFSFSDDYCNEQKEIKLENVEDLKTGDHINWLNIYGLSQADQIAEFCQKMGIDNLVIQDLLDLKQRPKFQEFEEYCFLTIKSTLPIEDKMEVEQISFIFGENFLISLQENSLMLWKHSPLRVSFGRD